MAHDKVYAVCENKCFVETKTKSEINSELNNFNNRVTTVETALEGKADKSELQYAGYNAIRGKKIIFLGDSITWGAVENLEQAAKPFPSVIAEKFGCTCVNEGIKGDTIALNILTGGMVGRITTFDFTGVDYLVLFGGTNDQQQGLPLEISEVDDINCSTMGAILNIKNFIRQQHPTVKLVVCSPIHKESTYEALNYGIATLATRIAQDCKSYCVPFIDLFNKSGLDFRDGFIRGVYASDLVHPNQAGYNLLGDYIGSKLAFNNFD